MLCIKSIETEEVKLMLGVSLIIIAAAIVYMVETYISTYYKVIQRVRRQKEAMSLAMDCEANQIERT